MSHPSCLPPSQLLRIFISSAQASLGKEGARQSDAAGLLPASHAVLKTTTGNFGSCRELQHGLEAGTHYSCRDSTASGSAAVLPVCPAPRGIVLCLLQASSALLFRSTF